VGLVYNPRGLPGVTTARPGVAGVLQFGFEEKLRWVDVGFKIQIRDKI
jgi:hypothetical protein